MPLRCCWFFKKIFLIICITLIVLSSRFILIWVDWNDSEMCFWSVFLNHSFSYDELQAEVAADSSMSRVLRSRCPPSAMRSNMTTLNWAQLYNFGFFTDFVYSYMNVFDDSNELSIAVRNPKTFFNFWAERDDYDIYLTFWGYRLWPTDQRLQIQQTNW